ncbi:BTAD domain-containing putative transcriptional regulator [Streptomyces sp. NPDC058193]|uniref:BTAD domain-containing putative transcriptional regulator n=1 Tax=Streptomyces sp. NPDC058193 TaxID=3346373 RepID=UPI0036F08F49
MPRKAVRLEGRARTGEAHLPELVRLNAVHPLRERRTPLLRTLADSGREVEALDAYTRSTRVAGPGVQCGSGCRAQGCAPVRPEWGAYGWGGLGMFL